MATLQQSGAATRTLNFQTAYPNANKGGKIPKDEILEIVQQANCEALRFYFALDNSGSPNGIQVIFVGVDENGDDILQSGPGSHSNTNAKLKGGSYVCPPACGVANELNHQ